MTTPTNAQDPSDSPTDPGRRSTGGDANLVAGDQFEAGADQYIHKTTVIQHHPPAVEVRDCLPPDPAFTGREEELQAILTAVTGAAEAGGVLMIQGVHPIEGMPGVGKTALAVHAAHLLRRRGLFPDRQLFIDLHAHTPGQAPTPPVAALAALLTAVGVDARYLPRDLDGRVALWRGQMADQRALLVLDNAAGSDQVLPLLPGGGSCLVLVTSRRHLGDLPATAGRILLPALPPDQAQRMFRRLAPHASTQLACEVDELVASVGYLPLAISLLARLYLKHPTWTLHDLTDETRHRLLKMAAENATIAAAFDLSYQFLPSDRQQVFRQLGLHPGATIDPYAAAALTATPLPEATAHLDALHSEGLLAEVSRRRYGMHDLIRGYAQALAANDPRSQRDRALERLLGYYEDAAAVADSRLLRAPRATLPAAALRSTIPELPDRTRALAWIRAERANLLACLGNASQHGDDHHVVTLTTNLASLLHIDGPWTDAVEHHTAAAAAATKLNDPRARADALNNLGSMQRLIGNYPAAEEVLNQALTINRQLGDQLGEAAALKYLGVVQYLTHDCLTAIQSLRQALDLCRATGNQPEEASVLTYLGAARRLTDDYTGATDALKEAEEIYRHLKDEVGQAHLLNETGILRQEFGDYAGAAHALRDALAIHHRLGDKLGEANALNWLGVVQRLIGHYQEAAHAHEQALTTYRQLGDRLGEANALNYLGAVRSLTGDQAKALQMLHQALGIYRDLGHQLGKANVLKDMGPARRLANDLPGADEALAEALRIYLDLHDDLGEAEVLNQRGALHLAQAEADYQRAHALATRVSNPLEQARALEGLGRCTKTGPETAAATAYQSQALALYRELGAAEANQLAAEMAKQ